VAALKGKKSRPRSSLKVPNVTSTFFKSGISTDWQTCTWNRKMTGAESRALKVGDRVMWKGDKIDRGTVSEISWAGVTISWDSRDKQSVLHNDMLPVTKA
jgi:hypothetical protein